jgi:hypothetical protein
MVATCSRKQLYKMSFFQNLVALNYSIIQGFFQFKNTTSREKFPGSRDEIINSLWAAFTAIFSLISGILVDKAVICIVF